MSTSVVDKAPSTTETDPAPEATMASVLYAEPAQEATPETAPEPKPDQDTQPQPDKADATPPADAKENPPEAKADGEKPDDVSKQLSAQRAANGRLGKENQQLKSQIADLARKVEEMEQRQNGTYKEPPVPTAEQIAAKAEFKGRESASRAVANQLFGEDEVEAQVYADDSPYAQLTKTKPWVHVEVVKHPQPAVAAMRVLAREQFFEKYGEDPAQWPAKIEAELKPKLFEEFKKSIAAPPVGKDVPTVSDARGGGGGGSRRERSLGDVLYGGSER